MVEDRPRACLIEVAAVSHVVAQAKGMVVATAEGSLVGAHAGELKRQLDRLPGGRGTGMSKSLLAVVVDNEEPALELMPLTGTGRVEVVGTRLPTADKGLAFPGWPEVDVAFLDIVMPGMTGIELARRLPSDPLVVFTTGYNEYAVEAFRVNAVDYLVKPIEHAHLEEALTRLEGRLSGPTWQGARVIAEQVARYFQAGTALGATGRIEYVGGRVGGKLRIVGVTEGVGLGCREESRELPLLHWADLPPPLGVADGVGAAAP